MKKTLWLPVMALLSCFSYAQRDTVIVRPAPINDVLQNPGMGITTFQRFNGQATNPPLESEPKIGGRKVLSSKRRPSALINAVHS
jgi:hypothetical protein